MHGFGAERWGRPRRLGSDRDGNLVDVRLSETRDKTAARAFFRPRARSLVVFQRGSRVMDIAPIPGRSRRSWEKPCVIARIAI